MQLADSIFRLYLIVQWIFLSSTIILFNKWLLSEAKFHFPLTLVIMHMTFVGICAQVWRRMGWAENPSISWSDVGSRFVPVAVLFAASLGFGNAAYLYITVAFVQMLKAITPVAVLLCSFGFGLEQASMRLFIYICLIATGVAVACYGQLQLDWLGVGLQLAAVLAEALRLCLVNIALTARGIKLSSVTFLSVVAPLCAAVLLPAWLYLEYPGVSKHHWSPVRKVGFAVLFANASVAFLLNLSTMALIKHTSALTLNISGVFKDLGLIGWSVIVSGAVVTKLQYVGYAVALVGVTGYSAYKRAQQQKLSGTPITPADERASKRTAHRLSGTGGAKDEEQPLGVTDEEEDAPSRRAP